MPPDASWRCMLLAGGLTSSRCPSSVSLSAGDPSPTSLASESALTCWMTGGGSVHGPSDRFGHAAGGGQCGHDGLALEGGHRPGGPDAGGGSGQRRRSPARSGRRAPRASLGTLPRYFSPYADHQRMPELIRQPVAVPSVARTWAQRHPARLTRQGSRSNVTHPCTSPWVHRRHKRSGQADATTDMMLPWSRVLNATE